MTTRSSDVLPGDGPDRLALARALVADLAELGCLPRRALAQLLGWPPGRIQFLSEPQRGGGLSRLSGEQLDELLAVRDAHCCARGRRIVWWLRTRQALGYPLWWQAQQLGLPDLDQVLRRPGVVDDRTYAQVATLARSLGEMAAVPGREVPAAEVYQARAEAHWLGYGPPAAYTRIGGQLAPEAHRDDFTRTRATSGGQGIEVDPEIEAEIVKLLRPPYGLAVGYTVSYLAGRYGFSVRTIERIKKKHGIRTSKDATWLPPHAPPVVRQPLDLAIVVPRPDLARLPCPA
jgi:hypothetical protein